jgi:hypothetical protein
MRTSLKGAVLACVGALVGSLCVVLGLGVTAAAAATYPPTTCATISVSTTQARPGQTISVTGKEFQANVTVRLYLTPSADYPGTVSAAKPAGSSVLLASVTTDANGTFSADVTMPLDARGHQILSADGPGKVCPADPIQINVSAGAGGGSSAPGGGGGPPAMTGVDVALLIGVALALLAAGVLFTQGGRRKHAGARR